jgi:hypothetical protein
LIGDVFHYIFLRVYLKYGRAQSLKNTIQTEEYHIDGSHHFMLSPLDDFGSE